MGMVICSVYRPSSSTQAYRAKVRAFVPGGTFFFTVNLLEPRRRLSTEHIEDLRAVFSEARQRRPFRIDAIVVLPDHLYCIWIHGHIGRVADWPYSSFEHYPSV